MIYLSDFSFPDAAGESCFLDFGASLKMKMPCYDTYYPFIVMPLLGLQHLSFDEPITLLYGNNGSGKTTILNVIARKIELEKETLINETPFFPEYLRLCHYHINGEGHIPEKSKYIVSDDVFDYILNLRAMNHKTDNVRERSNGESALLFFQGKIESDALYILDEPENSLSPEHQSQLAKYIEDSAFACNCQFIIATHSPFLLAMKRSRIYNIYDYPATIKKWTDLDSIRLYKNFFDSHEKEFC